MTVHVSTADTDYFFHSHEVRELRTSDTNDLVIKLIHPVGSKATYAGGKDKIYIKTDEVAAMYSMILEAIKGDKNISIHVKSFQII
jgi:hypothetical protein